LRLAEVGDLVEADQVVRAALELLLVVLELAARQVDDAAVRRQVFCWPLKPSRSPRIAT
jgi:hypothetical protein